MTRSLLDVNVLLALLDADHADHARARTWLGSHIDAGWASCPITENGFLRIISQDRYPSPVPLADAVARLRLATDTDLHEFWPCDVTILDPATADAQRLHGARQVTDAYLLALAASRGGRFVTLDRKIALSAAPTAEARHLHVI